MANRGPTTFTRKDTKVNQYRSWSPSVINCDDDISQAAGNGVLVAEGSFAASYNALNQPQWFYSGNVSGGFMSFGYDPLGRCVKRWTGGAADPATNPATYFYYDGSSLIEEGPNASTISQVYMLGNRVDEIVADYAMANGQWIYHHSDARSHSMILTDSGGNLVEQYEYDAFGQPYFFSASGESRTSSNYGNRFLFQGREYFPELGLYDYRHRFYDPTLGRFIQTDPMGLQTEGAKLTPEQKALYGAGAPEAFASSEMNLYRYVGDDPVDRSDPTGLLPVKIDEEVDKRSQEAAQKSMDASKANRGLFGQLYEYGTSVVQDAHGIRLSRTSTDGKAETVTPPSEPGAKTLVEAHNHIYDHSGDRTTHAQLSRDDIARAIKYGTPVVILTPNGSWERYRPSDKTTREARAQEGGIIERLQQGQWKRVSGANDDLTNPVAARNGY